MIIFTIIGTLIGAGFASGQEIYLFFYRFGLEGLIGLFVCSCIFSFAIYKVLNISFKNNIENYNDLINIIFNNKKILSNIVNKLINLFLCVTFFIMVAGIGTYLEQQFRIK